MPNIAIATILLNTFNNRFDCINLIRSHDQYFLFCCNKDHVTADHAAEGALLEEAVGKVVEEGDGFVVAFGEAIDGEELLGGVEGEMPGVVVGEVERLGAVADDEELDEAEEGAGVAVTVVVLVLDNLFHGPSRADAEGLEFDLDDGDAIDEEDDVVAVVTVVGVDPELVEDLEVVLAPIPDVDERVGKRSAIVACEVVLLAQDARGSEDVGGDQFVEEALEFAIGKADAVEGLELLAEVVLEGGAVADVGAMGVLETAQLFDEGVLDVLLFENERLGSRILRVFAVRGRWHGGVS